ncbi:MAG TPA: sulfatase-like hydrolase/transferase [Actinophytocola sp.]|uniref:sulfatase-like hydrolase/transferase n=1 Tax=Actinophytocola sp. TaxID=1872138 RepID=UPI002DFD671C|nr:sulfatase-like hydrolase/transferase [Actinophytocola sp.]
MTIDVIDEETGTAAEEPPARRRPVWRRAAARVLTAGACLLVLFGLLAPNDLDRLTVAAFLRIPVEALVLTALVLVLPPRAGRILAGIAGALLGLLTVLKIADMGFDATLYRGFDPVLDWTFLEAGVDYVAVTAGRFAATAAVVGAIVLVVALIVFTTLAALRLTRIATRHPTATTRTARALVVVWLVCAVLGVEIEPGLPVASRTAATYAYAHARQVPAAIQDAKNFAAEAAVDAFRGTPGDQLLTALRGKDVVLTFVESYGRTVLDNPELAELTAVLDAGTARLDKAGFDSRSAYLTSSTYGGGSWLAHATLDAGLWINNQQRYRNLVTTDRLTLVRAFREAGWRTVGVEPAVTQAYPEGAFFGYDKVYAAADLGYRGTRFSYATMPDQYVLSAFQRSERAAPGHAPVMAQIVTLTSHAPWSPVPRLIGWNDVGDGRIFDTMAGDNAKPESIFSSNPERVRANYRRSIEYALNNLISYVETYGDDNLVLIFLGDHQPATVVTGQGASHDVPVTVVARDPAVLARISAWGWDTGLKPGPRAPVWGMNEFRDRFLSAYGSPPR